MMQKLFASKTDEDKYMIMFLDGVTYYSANKIEKRIQDFLHNSRNDLDQFKFKIRLEGEIYSILLNKAQLDRAIFLFKEDEGDEA